MFSVKYNRTLDTKLRQTCSTPPLATAQEQPFTEKTMEIRSNHMPETMYPISALHKRTAKTMEMAAGPPSSNFFCRKRQPFWSCATSATLPATSSSVWYLGGGRMKVNRRT